MSEHSNGPTGPPPAQPPAPGPGAPNPGAPEPPPGAPAPGSHPATYAENPYAASAAPPYQQAQHPMPQWYPARPRRPFRERTTRAWLALVAALASLIVGFGIGFAVGHAGGEDDHGPGRFGRYPDRGGPFGFRDGHRGGFGDRRAFPNDQPGGQQPTPPQPSPSATP